MDDASPSHGTDRMCEMSGSCADDAAAGPVQRGSRHSLHASPYPPSIGSMVHV